VRDFSAVLLAGERGPGDPLARAADCPSKALVPVAGTPVILRAMSALDEATCIGQRTLVGPNEGTLTAYKPLGEHLRQHAWQRILPADSPASSALAGLESSPRPTLVTTADHGLLRAEIVDYFCREASTLDADLVIGFTRYGAVMNAFPAGRRTGWRFRDDRYCGSNLYAFMTPAAGEVAAFWRRVERDRKKPWRVVGALGPGTLIRFLLRRMSLTEALAALGKRTGTTVQAVVLPFPEAAVDVDSVADWHLVNQWLAKQ
jgi:GTP:adenosylcobinamide-phosphate guanylyltransferase